MSLGSDRHLSLRRFMSFALLGVPLFITACTGPSQGVRQGLFVQNPYANVDWARDGRYKANFHTHTTGSDGSFMPHEAIDGYRALEYSILALTDHDVVSWPWEQMVTNQPSKYAKSQLLAGTLEATNLVYQNREPGTLGMINIQGCELSAHHHTGSYFNDHSGSKTEEESLSVVTGKDGIAMLNHPGRDGNPVGWYVDLYRKYPVLFGLEVYNQGDRYPNDRKTWDAILSKLMPDRPVWGYSNDDMHQRSHLGRNWSILFLSELSSAMVRRGMIEGRSYFVYSPAGHNGPPPPVIDSVTVDSKAGTIQVRASGYTNIAWISEGRTIQHGDILHLATQKNVGSYVRAELRGASNTVAGTQPFGIIRPVRTRLDLETRPGQIVYANPNHVQGGLLARNITDLPLDAELVVRLDSKELARKTMVIPANADTNITISIPIDALNLDKSLDVEWDLGPAFGGFRKVNTEHPIPAFSAPVELTMQLPSIQSAQLWVRNTLTNQPVTFTLTATLDRKEVLNEVITLATNETVMRPISLPAGLLGREASLKASARFDSFISPTPLHLDTKINLRNEQAIPRLAKPITLDGNLDEWSSPIWVLNHSKDVLPADRRARWTDTNDLDVAIAWGWDGEALCMAVKVQDDLHQNLKSGNDIWDGDSIQLAVLPEGAAAISIGIALTSNGATFHQWNGATISLNQADSFVVVRNDQTRTTAYELRIPLAKLGLQAAAGTRLGFAMVCFDDDSGKGFDCWMQTAPGVAGGWAPEKLPRFFLSPSVSN